MRQSANLRQKKNNGVVAQWLERRSYKAVVVSSILTNPTGKRRKGVDKEERSCIMSLTV